MSLSNVNSIDALEALNNALSQYREQSLATVQGFASALSNKIVELEKSENYFAEKVRRAESALRSCEIARAYDPPNDKRSCSSQADALSRAQANYSCYKSIVANVLQAVAEYKEQEGRYNYSLSEISSVTVPSLSQIIAILRDYSSGEDITIAGTPAGHTGTTANNATPINATSHVASGEEKPVTDVNNDSVVLNNGESSFSETTIIASGIGVGIVAGIATTFLMNHLQQKGEMPEILIENAFREKYGIGKTELLLMPQSPEKDKLIRKYNALCHEVETQVKKEYDKKMKKGPAIHLNNLTDRWEKYKDKGAVGSFSYNDGSESGKFEYVINKDGECIGVFDGTKGKDKLNDDVDILRHINRNQYNIEAGDILTKSSYFSLIRPEYTDENGIVWEIQPGYIPLKGDIMTYHKPQEPIIIDGKEYEAIKFLHKIPDSNTSHEVIRYVPKEEFEQNSSVIQGFNLTNENIQKYRLSDKYYQYVGTYNYADGGLLNQENHKRMDVNLHDVGYNFYTSPEKIDVGINDFKINGISQSLPEDSESIKFFKKAAQDAGIVGVVSKNDKL